MTRFLGDTITLTHGCLTNSFAGSLPETPGIPHLHYFGKMRERNSTCSSQASMCTESLVLCHPLSTPALAEVIRIAISNLLFFLAPSNSLQFPCLFHIPFHFSCPLFPAVIFPQTEHSGQKAKALSHSASLSTFLYKHFHSQGYVQSETARTSALWQMLHHPREVAGALNYRASRFCWNSATREGNAVILAKSQLQV